MFPVVELAAEDAGTGREDSVDTPGLLPQVIPHQRLVSAFQLPGSVSTSETLSCPPTSETLSCPPTTSVLSTLGEEQSAC